MILWRKNGFSKTNQSSILLFISRLQSWKKPASIWKRLEFSISWSKFSIRKLSRESIKRRMFRISCNPLSELNLFQSLSSAILRRERKFTKFCLQKSITLLPLSNNLWSWRRQSISKCYWTTSATWCFRISKWFTMKLNQDFSGKSSRFISNQIKLNWRRLSCLLISSRETKMMTFGRMYLTVLSICCICQILKIHSVSRKGSLIGKYFQAKIRMDWSMKGKFLSASISVNFSILLNSTTNM